VSTDAYYVPVGGYSNSNRAVMLYTAFMVFSLAGLGMGLMLLVLVVWKENPMFWRNAGGYPIWLRSMVLYAFYPLLLLDFLTLGLASMLTIKGYLQRLFRTPKALVVMAGIWGLFALVIVFLLWNNIQNLLADRDVHFHGY
jgi:hypothetical protein